jgi:hypothetical protein
MPVPVEQSQPISRFVSPHNNQEKHEED